MTRYYSPSQSEFGSVSIQFQFNIYDNIHEKLFWRFFKDCDKNIDLILKINIFLIHQLVCFWEKFVKMPISGPVEA